jgi:hypothetical protein
MALIVSEIESKLSIVVKDVAVDRGVIVAMGVRGVNNLSVVYS